MWDGGFIAADRAKLKQRTFTQVVTTFSFYSPFLKVITVENLVIRSLYEDCKIIFSDKINYTPLSKENLQSERVIMFFIPKQLTTKINTEYCLHLF